MTSMTFGEEFELEHKILGVETKRNVRRAKKRTKKAYRLRMK